MRVIHKTYYHFELQDKKCFELFIKNNQLSLRAFAKKCGISPSYLYDIVSGNRTASDKIIKTFNENGFFIGE